MAVGVLSRQRVVGTRSIDDLLLAVKVIISGLAAAHGSAGADCMLGDDAPTLSNTAAVSGVACLACLCHCC